MGMGGGGGDDDAAADDVDDSFSALKDAPRNLPEPSTTPQDTAKTPRKAATPRGSRYPPRRSG